MLKAVEDVQRTHKMRPVRKITIELSEFSSVNEEHFKFHFLEATKGTDFEKIELEFLKVPFGPEAQLVQVTF